MSGTWAQPRVSRTTVTVALIAAALAAWILTADRMRGMDAGPGTSLGGLGWYLGVWVTMMAAMMLPSTVPMVVLFARVSAERARRGQSHVPTSIFVLAYLLVWAAYGLAAYGLYRIVVRSRAAASTSRRRRLSRRRGQRARRLRRPGARAVSPPGG